MEQVLSIFMCSASVLSIEVENQKMGRAPCCSKVGLHKGPWTPKEDALLTKYILAHGEGQWKSLPKKAGLLRCGKSCRLRWMNYLRPDIKRGNITREEDDLIIRMHSLLGNRWSLIAGRIPGRTDNEIKNYWNTHLSKKLQNQGTGDTNTQLVSGNKKKKNKKKKKGTDDAEPAKTQVYLPKPIRVKALCLPRTFDSNSASGSTSQEKETKESNVVSESYDFGFLSEDHDLVNASLQELYEEYFQILNMDSFAESLLD